MAVRRAVPDQHFNRVVGDEVAQDLPEGWDKRVRELLDFMPKRLDDYDKMCMDNGLLKRRTQGVGSYTTEEAFDWAVTGPGLRATGLEWDLRKQRPYSGYENFEFDVPIAVNGDCYDRCAVRVEEMKTRIRLSLPANAPHKVALIALTGAITAAGP